MNHTHTKTMTKTRKPLKNMCTQEEVIAKFYEIGFKLNFIKALMGTELAHVWDYYKT